MTRIFRRSGSTSRTGKELAPVEHQDGDRKPGQIPNFYKKPNGVFYLAGKAAGVVTTDAWRRIAAEGATSRRSRGRCW